MTYETSIFAELVDNGLYIGCTGVKALNWVESIRGTGDSD